LSKKKLCVLHGCQPIDKLSCHGPCYRGWHYHSWRTQSWLPASFSDFFRLTQRPRFLTLAVCALLAGTVAQTQPTFAGDASAPPAVSKTNGKIELLGGSLDNDSAAALAGSLTAPLGHAFGVQVDGLAGNLDGNGTWGLGTHLF